MKITRPFLLFFTLSILITTVASAQFTVFKSIQNGPWDADYVWDQGVGEIPGPGDIVIIDGHQITLDTSIFIQELTITNATGPTKGELIIAPIDPITIEIADNLNLIAENRELDVEFHIKGKASIIINRDLNITRVTDNITNNRSRLYLYGDSETLVMGNLNLLHKNSADTAPYSEVFLDDNAFLQVKGITNLIIEGGNILEFLATDSSNVILDSLVVNAVGGKGALFQSVNNSKITIGSDVILKNTGALHQVKMATGYDGGTIKIDKSLTLISAQNNLKTIVETNGPTSSMEVKGDIFLAAESDSSIYINIINESPLSLGGNIIRSNSFGNLISKDGGELILNGSGQQSIPGNEHVAGTNEDQFSVGKITFSNTSGLPVILQGDLTFTDTLRMTTGNIVSSEAAMMIIGPNAVIKDASENAYIEGPIKKVGSTGGEDFDFPIGDATRFAPMRISPVTSNTSEYIARYDGDPPPFGENNAVNVEVVTGNQTWSLEPSTGSDPVAVTLFWDDPVVSGVELEEDLIVVGLDETDHWQNKGNTNASLTSPGNVTTIMLGDPPPFGEHILSFGLEPGSSLPVELTKFGAVRQDDKVYIEWYTSSEINASHFELQRSIDKENFASIYTVNSTGSEEFTMKYATLDLQPAQGMNYYRLKMIDQDGSFEYSHVEVVEFEASTEIMIYPNPVIDMLKVQGGTSTGSKTFEVYDRNGLLLHQRVITFEDGIFEISLDEINVTAFGTYFIRITDGVESKVIKFLKIK